jgi:hypothetical protein
MVAVAGLLSPHMEQCHEPPVSAGAFNPALAQSNAFGASFGGSADVGVGAGTCAFGAVDPGRSASHTTHLSFEIGLLHMHKSHVHSALPLESFFPANLDQSNPCSGAFAVLREKLKVGRVEGKAALAFSASGVDKARGGVIEGNVKVGKDVTGASIAEILGSFTGRGFGGV